MDNVKVNFKGSPVTLVGTHLQTGDKAPRFTVLDGDLQPVSLSQYKDKNLIISVFPSVDTSVCALQNIRFNKEASKLKGDVEIL
ncbi:redoxin domain-containing protein, partial [Alistipes indistinctus]